MTDMVMPGMTGGQLVEQLAAEELALPVLFVSGHTEDKVFEQGRLAAEHDFLQKPFTRAELGRKVGGLLGGIPRI